MHLTKDEILNLSQPKINDLIDDFMRAPDSYDHYPDWSADIGAAWQVVDKMPHDQKHLVWHEDEKKWVFIFGKGTWGRWSAWASKPAEAICKAALLYINGHQSF